MLIDALNDTERRWQALRGQPAARLAQAVRDELLRPCFGDVGDRVACEPPAAAAPGSALTVVHVVERLDEAAMAEAASRARQRKAARADGAARLACHLLALEGPARMTEAHGLLKQAYADLGIVDPDLPPTGAERCTVPSPALDGVFVPGTGFLNFDNVPLGFLSDASRATVIGLTWVIAQAEVGALMSLALQLHQAGLPWADPATDLPAALARFSVAHLRIGN